MAVRRTFRTRTSSQQSGIKSKHINTHITTIPNTQYTSNKYTTNYSVHQNLVHNTANLVPQLPLPPIHSTSISLTISRSCIRCYYISHTTTTTMPNTQYTSNQYIKSRHIYYTYYKNTHHTVHK